MQTYIHKNRILFLHLSFWAVYFSFFIYQVSAYRGKEIELSQLFLFAFLQVIFNAVMAYFNYFLLLPRFLENKKFWRYLAEFTVPFALLIFVRVHIQRYVVDGYTYQEGYFYSSRYVVQLSAITLFITIFVGMLRFAVEWFRVEATKKEVENEKLQAELNFLKAQINPHFLFNTLNNLYYLAYTQSPNTTEVISKLSHVMRYMIDDARHAKVLLKKEIEYMENYISLERLRLNNQIPIDFSVEGEVGGLEVAPLVFITFLENAFKHGVSNNSTEAWVKILVKVTGHHVHYQVENSKLDTLHQPEDPRKGLGLANVKRRLELSYPGKHTLTIEDLPHRYAINLKIDLA